MAVVGNSLEPHVETALDALNVAQLRLGDPRTQAVRVGREQPRAHEDDPEHRLHPTCAGNSCASAATLRSSMAGAIATTA